MSHYPTYDSWGSRSDQANSCKLQEAQLSCCRRISIWHILFELSLIVMHMTSLHMTRSPMLSSVMKTGSDQIPKAVWLTVQWTVSLHIRAACKDKGWETLAHENISTENGEQYFDVFPCRKISQTDPSLKWSKDEDMKWHAFFLLQMKLCLLHQEKHASYLQLIWTCESFYCQLLFFSIWPLEITLHN